MPEPHAYICDTCELGWNNEASAERCCDEDTGGYSPSRGRVSYDLGYD